MKAAIVILLCIIAVGIAEEHRRKRQVDYASGSGSRFGGSSASRDRSAGAGAQRDRSAPHRRPSADFGGFGSNVPSFGPPEGFGQNPFGPGPNTAHGGGGGGGGGAPRQRRPVQTLPRFRQAPAPHRAPAAIPRAPVEAPRPQRVPVAAPRPYRAPARRQRQPTDYQQQEEQYVEPQEEEEESKIDPLTELLSRSTFECGSNKNGYYADSSEDINCQAFHYCADGKKHSWMCQDGQSFHQVHLICVPGDNSICQKSSSFSFVNDYLYKPLKRENNVTIYADRFYPENYSVGDIFEVPSKEHQQPQEYAVPQGYNDQRRPAEQAPRQREQAPRQREQAPRRRPAAQQQYAQPQDQYAYQDPAYGQSGQRY